MTNKYTSQEPDINSLMLVSTTGLSKALEDLLNKQEESIDYMQNLSEQPSGSNLFANDSNDLDQDMSDLRKLMDSTGRLATELLRKEFDNPQDSHPTSAG